MMNTEETAIPFKLSPLAEGDAPKRVVPHPTGEYLARQAFLTDPAKTSDEESRAAAQVLSKEVLTAQTIAEMPEESFKTEDEKTAAASKIVELMTGEKDYDGRLWNGGTGFKTGADYLRSVKETLSRGIGAAADPDLQAWLRMTDEEKDAKIDAERGVLSYFGEAAGDVAAGVGELARGVPQLSKDEYASAPQDVREASDWMASVMWDTFGEKERAEYEAKVREWRGGEWQRLKRRSEYEAKLRRKNALLYLPDMIKSLQSDEAKELAGELSQNPSEIPNNWTARLKQLPTRDIETLAQIRGMTREHVEGGFFNWLGDMGIAAYNGAHGILSGLGAQEAKYAAMAMGWDGERVNEMIRRKHALWSAYAGWSSPVSQISDQHGAVANFTIGLASAVPFIASMKLKGLGYMACAGEMMSEADAQAAAAGIDTTNPIYCAQNALAGGLYAYMLKAVSPKFLGASANGAAEEMALRTAFMKGLMSGFTKLDTLKVMSQRTAAGSLMMAMQQAIAAVNEDLNLGGDAWRDASQRFTETFVSSIPDMLAFSAHGVLEGHARASGGWRKMFGAEGRANRSQNLREAVENAFAVRAAVDGDRGVDERMQVIRLQQLQHMADVYTLRGKKGLLELGLKPEVADEAVDLFEQQRREYGDAKALELEWRNLDSQLDGQTLEEFDEDMLNRRNEAKRRFDQMMGNWDMRRAHLFETMKDVPGTLRDIASVRNVWAQGHAVGAGMTDGTDAGAAALVKAGFTPEDAAILSREFGAERRAMYSPAATEALREMYTRSTRGMVEAHAALASAFKGKVRTENGRVLIDLPMPDGGTGTLAVETVDLSRQFYGEAGSAPEMARQVEHATNGEVKADDWIKMTDAERRRIVRKYQLQDEGYFMLTDPADPSLHVDSGDADAVMGVIRLDPTADPGAGFHESMHGFLRFCQETGFFDEADVKWLTDTYGTPQNAKEQLNEESAADGFRQYLAKRMAGSFVEEPGPFRKLFGLISRIRHLRDSRAATERLAANAEEALYDAFLAGKYQHIRDLTFAEPVAPKAETGTGTEAPQTGAPLDKSAPTEQKLVQPQVRETQSQTAVVDESGATSQKLVQPTAPRVVSFEALTPTGGKKVKGHYEIVPLASLLHSNMAGYPMELQQRDRKGNKGEEQTREEHIANFEPGYLLADPKTDSGAMVVARRPGPDGKPQLVVVSGNGRTMVLEEMAKRNLYDRYRNRMKEWAKENGIENTVADADNPVLVRVVDELGGATLKELADLSNTNAIQQMNEEEQARADADLVRSLDLAKLYKPNMDGSANMAAGASDEFFREFVRATGDTSLLNSDGTFTEALRMRARRALLAIACGQGERGRDVVKKLVEDTDALGIDRQKDTAAAIAPHVAAIETRPEYAIGPDVSRAFADYIEFRENRDTGKKWGTLEEYLKQGDMLDPRSEIAESVMRLLDDPKSAPVLAETVRLYVEAAKGETDGLFGAARTRAEIWRDAAKAVDAEAAEKRYSIAGKVAASNMGIKGAGDAEAMEKAGKDREEIWRTTGWWRGKDGRWRFELPSVKMKSEKEIEAALREGINGLRGGSSETTLEKVLDAPALFEAYPRLKKTKIVFSPEHDDKTGGWYDAGKNEIVLLDTGIKDLRHRPKHEQDLYDTYQQVINSDEFLQKRFSNMDAFGIKHGTAEEERALAKDWIAKFDKSIQDENAAMVRDLVKDRGQYSAFGKIVHEVQHAVQYMETFAKGGNPESAAEFVKNMKRKQRIWAYRLEVEETAKELGTTNPYEIERAILEKLGVTSREQIAGLEADGWIPDREGRDKGYNLFARGYDKEGYEEAYNEYLGEMRKTGRAGWWEGSPRELYNRLAGEVEARNASRREAMSPEERAATPPWETEDVPADRQIVRYSVTAQRVTPEEDAAYADAVKRGDMETVRRMEREVYERMGYSDDSSYQGTSAFNGAAPSSNAYFETKAERIEAAKNGEMEDTTTLGDFRDGIDVNNLQFIVFDPRSERNANPMRQEAIRNIRDVLDGGKDTITMYRSVPADVKEGQFRNGDWITPSRAYAEDNARIHGWGKKFRVIEQEVSVEDVWWDGNDIAEWGFDDGKGSVYKNTRANRKLLGPTYDNAGNLIPLSKRFNDWHTDARYSLKAGTASDYTWATLTAKPDMQLAQIDPDKFKNYETDSERVSDAHKSVIAAGGEKVGKNYYIRMDGERVLVGNAGIKHRGRKANLANDFVFPVLGEVLKNAVRVNELEPRANKKQDKFATDIFVYLGALSYGQEILPVRIQVEHRGRERRIDRIDVLRSLNTKIGTVAALGGLAPATPVPGTAAAFGGLAPAYQPLPAISISNLIRIAQPLHPDIFSRDVAANLNAPYSGTKIGARYSVTARTPSDEIKADPESFARRSIVSRVIDGDAEERESALVAFVAERALRHGPKPNAFKTIARLGLEMGLKTVNASNIVKKGEALADRVRGTVIEKAIRKGDVATATALLARESDIDRLVAGAAGQGGQLVRAGEGKIKSFLDREIEKHIRSFNAASLADVERDTGIDIAGEILANSPERFDPKGSAKREEAKAEAGEAGGEEGAVPGAGAPDEGNITDFERARRERVRKEAEERVAKMIATAKQRAEEAEKQRADWEAKREERKRQAEAAAAGEGGEAGEAGDGAGGESGGEGGIGGETSMPERPQLSTFADFKTPEEFAAFFRVWAEERYKKEHGASTLGKHEEKRLFPEFYRKAVVKELQDLADKLLPPKGARAAVNRWLGEIQPGVKPDTLERISADVFAFINRNAIRESRTATIQKFRNGLQEFIKGPQFDDLKLDSDRKVTGWVEEAARYIRRVCNLSIQSINGEPSQLEKERAELQAILDRRSQVYDEEGKNSADAPLFDMETRRALAKLQLLEKYGAMKRYMPGQIADLANEAMTWLRDEAGKLEDAWKSARETEESIRSALTGGIVGPNGQKYQRAEGVKGWAERLFDSMNGMIRLRLQHLVRFADSANQQKARDAINRVIVMLGDGEVAFTRHTQNDRRAFEQALTRIFATPDGKGFDRRAMADWLNRMTEAIPADLSRQLSKQGYGDSMTYGQMLQLLVSLEQKSYSEAIAANKRDGQADLIRTFETVGPDGRRERVLTDKDILFIDWLRSFYEAKRTQLSEVTKRMTGLPIDSPDPLYCPVKMYMGDRARGMHVDDTTAWDPIGAVFSRRVETLRDFDESASILGQFFDRSAEAAKLAAWAERGSIIRGVFTNASVQESIRRAFGGGELTKILKQLEETFNGGENIRKSPGEIAAADKAMNWMTYLSLGYNPLSAMKQTTSFTVWANALPGGFKDLWRYMTDVDMATIKHIKESEEYKVRYGVDVGSGQDVATRALNDDPSENPIKKFFKKTSMGLLRKGDFLPGGWIAQGLFRDLYNRHLKEGMDADAADRLAMTETFNMLEETQQSGRTYNTAALAREHGRLGRLLVQFATSPLQQLQYETQALREVWDLQRYKPTTPDADFEKRYSEAKGKLVRAAVINHVLLPAALHAVTNLYRYAMGYDPEWDQEGWHWTMLRDITLGQFSRVFFIGAISSVTWDTLITGKPMRELPAMIPAEGVVKLAGNLGVTARDIAKLDYEKVQKDLDRLLKSTSITRTPYDIGRLVTGKAYAEREERREKRRQKAARQK